MKVSLKGHSILEVLEDRTEITVFWQSHMGSLWRGGRAGTLPIQAGVWLFGKCTVPDFHLHPKRAVRGKPGHTRTRGNGRSG